MSGPKHLAMLIFVYIFDVNIIQVYDLTLFKEQK